MGTAFEPRPLEEANAGGGWKLALVATVLVVAGTLVAYLWYTSVRGTVPAPVPERLPALGAEEKAYLPDVEITGLAVSAAVNMLGQEITYLDGDVRNLGARTIRALELALEFQDVDGKKIHQQTLRAIGSRSSPSPLGPGQARHFQHAFETRPPGWNRRPPVVRVSALLLESKD